MTKRCLTGVNSKFCVILGKLNFFLFTVFQCINFIVLGSQWGDEGKGKLVDILADKYDYCCRFNGGNNAGNK